MFEGHVGFPVGVQIPPSATKLFMTSISQILLSPADRSVVVSNLKEYILQRHEEISILHKNGASGLYLVTRIAALTDKIISEIYNHELRRYENSHNISLNEKCSVVAVSLDRKSTRLNSSHGYRSSAVFCLRKKLLHDGAGGRRVDRRCCGGECARRRR